MLRYVTLVAAFSLALLFGSPFVFGQSVAPTDRTDLLRGKWELYRDMANGTMRQNDRLLSDVQAEAKAGKSAFREIEANATKIVAVNQAVVATTQTLTEKHQQYSAKLNAAIHQSGGSVQRAETQVDQVEATLKKAEKFLSDGKVALDGPDPQVGSGSGGKGPLGDCLPPWRWPDYYWPFKELTK